MFLHIEHAVIHLPPFPFAPGVAITPAPGPDTAARAAASPSILVPPAYGEIWSGQGGYHVGSQPAMHGTAARHLIASVEEAAALKWGGYGEEADAKSHWHGPSNTAGLMSDNEAHPAAQWCEEYSADGHSDFHLPSRADLLMAFMCAPERFNKSGYYWSSTQLSRGLAFVQAFEGGHSFWGSKGGEYRVRAFRWIHFNP